MKTAAWIAAILLLSGSVIGCAASEGVGAPPNQQEQQQQLQRPQQQAESVESDEAAVKGLIESFGQRLKMVSLTAPADVVKATIQEQYSDLVSPDLLAKWQGDLANAPGRVVSSPWPDRIEIKSIEKLPDGSYRVEGEIIVVTSAEKVSGGAAARRPVTLTVAKVGDRWRITGYEAGAYEMGLLYKNHEYGFNFSLPASWEGYSIQTSQWEGLAVGVDKPVESGPVISIRHPLWTEAEPRQDIPIMVFTLEQWKSLQAGEFHIGAAPMGPRELGRNSQYVFALPARYNYAFPTGCEEVEEILAGNPLRAIDPRPE